MVNTKHCISIVYQQKLALARLKEGTAKWFRLGNSARIFINTRWNYIIVIPIVYQYQEVVKVNIRAHSTRVTRVIPRILCVLESTVGYHYLSIQPKSVTLIKSRIFILPRSLRILYIIWYILHMHYAYNIICYVLFLYAYTVHNSYDRLYKWIIMMLYLLII